jgi:serine/threonine protein phosphatase PrpC
MKPDDLFAKPPPEKPTSIIFFAGHGFTHQTDECFILVDGFPGLPHAREAEQLTSETALWAYQMVRQSPFYGKERLHLLERIFRSTNLRLWQKRRDPGFNEGLASALMVLITNEDYFWVGSAGNCNSFLFRDGLIDILTKRDVDDEGMLTKAVGFARKQLLPTKHSEKLLEGDCILMATDSVADFVSEDQMRGIFETAGSTNESLQSAVNKFIEVAKAAGSRDTMSLCLVKRIVL